MDNTIDIDSMYDAYRYIEPKMSLCEICGEEYNVAYYDIDNNFVGCDACITISYE